MSAVVNSFTLLASCFLLTLVASVIGLDLYTNQWAVEIKGGHSVAEEIARQHGFKNLGQIGSLTNHYLFEHHRVLKRSVDASTYHHTRLKRNPEVRWSEQQIIKKRVKRGFKDTIHDPLWSHQWYLHGGSSLGFDMNVLPVWQQGVSGKGVVVTILDDGIERDHPDLVENYDAEASKDINGNDDDPMPRQTYSNENRHGTRCAGEVAAGLNSFCGVGVAFNSSIGGVRMLDGDVTDAVEAQSLSHNPQHVHIYSASWGPDDDGKVVDGPGPLAKRAFIDGVTKGRQGKGSIFVWASGNGGAMKDSCSCDGYSNSIYTMSISSTSEHGRKPWYLEECASTLATTYSSGENYNREKQIVTTDLNKGCTESHTGTSASAPLAAGLLALALEVNPELTWRDVQYITLMTSRPEPMIDGNWIVNGVGRKVSHRYGYGLMDAAKMVELARKWATVPEKFICEETPVNVEHAIKDRFMVNITSTGCQGKTNAVKFLEHVQLKVTMRFPHRGDAQLNLVSPKKTRATLLPRRQNDYNRGEFKEWPFLSVFYWGEDPKGNWTAEFVNTGRRSDQGSVLSYQLILHGTQINPVRYKSDLTTAAPSKTTTASSQVTEKGHKPVDITVIEGENETTDNGDDSKGFWMFGKSKTKTKCHSECEGGCNGTGANQCKSCKHYQLAGYCVASCPPDGYTVSEETKECARIDCHPTCGTCRGPNESDCITCTGHLYYSKDTSVCMTTCEEGFYADQQNVCQTCSSTCRACAESANHCISCSEGKILLNELCVETCPAATFASSEGCKPCPVGCLNCSGPADGDCLLCAHGSFLLNGSCLFECDMDGYYEDNQSDVWICGRCHPSCLTCTGSNETDCSSCADGLPAQEGRCSRVSTLAPGTSSQAQCSPGHFKDAFDDCLPCHYSCKTCHGAMSSDCISCKDNYTPSTDTSLDDDDDTRVTCNECHATCKTCSGPGADECTSCVGSSSLEGGRCGNTCSQGEYKESDGFCSVCHSSCLECSGSHDNECLACDASMYLHSGRCMDSCPEGYYGNGGHHCLQCDPSCKTCSDKSRETCLSCANDLQLKEGQCVTNGRQEVCSSGHYYDSSLKTCHLCDISCSKCVGGSSTECTECDSDYILTNGECLSMTSAENRDSGYNLATTVSPAHTQNAKPQLIENESTNQEEDSDDDMDNYTTNDRTHNSVDHARIRTASTINVEKTIHLENPPLTQEGDSVLTSHPKAIFVIVMCCVLATAVFFTVFGILQARSHGKWCFRSVGYQKVPTLYDTGRDRILLTPHDFDDEDEIF